MRPGPHHIATTGAVDGDVLTYDADADEYGPAPVGSGVDSVVVSVTNGVPSFVFDADSSPVTTEVPS